MGGWAEGQACADPGARTLMGASGNLFIMYYRTEKENFIRRQDLKCKCWNEISLILRHWKSCVFTVTIGLITLVTRNTLNYFQVWPEASNMQILSEWVSEIFHTIAEGSRICHMYFMWNLHPLAPLYTQKTTAGEESCWWWSTERKILFYLINSSDVIFLC